MGLLNFLSVQPDTDKFIFYLPGLVKKKKTLFILPERPVLLEKLFSFCQPDQARAVQLSEQETLGLRNGINMLTAQPEIDCFFEICIWIPTISNFYLWVVQGISNLVLQQSIMKPYRLTVRRIEVTHKTIETRGHETIWTRWKDNALSYRSSKTS